MEQTIKEQATELPSHLYDDGKTNMYCLHEVFRQIAITVKERIKTEHHIDIPISSGLWGGAYLVCDPQGKVLSRVIRFYSIVNLPQNSPLCRGTRFKAKAKGNSSVFVRFKNRIKTDTFKTV